MPYPGGNDYFCAFQMMGTDTVHRAGGVDARMPWKRRCTWPRPSSVQCTRNTQDFAGRTQTSSTSGSDLGLDRRVLATVARGQRDLDTGASANERRTDPLTRDPTVAKASNGSLDTSARDLSAVARSAKTEAQRAHGSLDTRAERREGDLKDPLTQSLPFHHSVATSFELVARSPFRNPLGIRDAIADQH